MFERSQNTVPLDLLAVETLDTAMGRLVRLGGQLCGNFGYLASATQRRVPLGTRTGTVLGHRSALTSTS